MKIKDVFVEDAIVNGIPDAVESMLGNNTTFLQFYKFTRVHTELWDSYAWCIAYYFSLKLNKSWDEIYSNIKDDPTYYIPHYNGESAYNKSCGENATKWLTSQFNAMVKENMPPMVVKFRLRVSNGKLHWHILVRDVGKIRNVLINDLTGSEFYVNSDINSVVFEREGSFNLSTGEQLFRVKIELVSYDMVGNKLDMVKVVNGVVGEIVDAISQYVSLLFHVFGEVAKAVMDAVNVILEWIVSQVKNMINATLQPVIHEIITVIDNSVNHLLEGDLEGAFYALLPILTLAGITIFSLIFAIGTLIDLFPPAGLVVLGVVTVILTAVLVSAFSGYDEYKQIGESIGSDLNSIRSFLEGLSTDIGNLWWIVGTFVNLGNVIFLALLDMSPTAVLIAFFGTFFLGVIFSATIAASMGILLPFAPSSVPYLLLPLALELISVTSLSLGLGSIFGSKVIGSSPGRTGTALVWVLILYAVSIVSILINLGYISKCVGR